MSGRRTTRRDVAAWVAVLSLVGATPAHAGHALVDLLDTEVLEQVEPNAVVAPDRTLDLLLVEVVRERVAAAALGYGTSVPVVVVGGDPGPSLAAYARLGAGELLQLVLLARSRSAVATLATAVGPGWERARLRMRRAAARLELRGTTVPNEWPGEQRDGGAARDATIGAGRKVFTAPATSVRRAPDARTTLGDVARLAAAVAGDGEMRRRLALDGAPIADGAVIVRATDPLIARMAAPTPPVPARAGAVGGDAQTAIAIGEHDGLALLAVATGPEAARDVWQVLQRGLTRYRRVEVVRTGQSVGGDVEARDGVVAHVTAVAAQSFALTVPSSGAFALRAWLQLPQSDETPLEPNQPMGELVFEQAGRIIAAVPLVAPAPSGPSRWLDTASR
ncbi:MAG: hypothetical protein HY271_07350 [Deltaproteobacteria bacterium]|nr:hypothetical protein [Deltaproteobacteria bacterium]